MPNIKSPALAVAVSFTILASLISLFSPALAVAVALNGALLTVLSLGPK